MILAYFVVAVVVGVVFLVFEEYDAWREFTESAAFLVAAMTIFVAAICVGLFWPLSVVLLCLYHAHKRWGGK